MHFLTFLNNGCVDICRNMLTSAERVGFNLNDFTIACLDTECFDKMKKYPGCYLHSEQKNTEYQNWSFDPNSGFRTIVKSKWKIIREHYKKHKQLCWVDTDIVFVKNPLPYIEKNDKILFQCDSPGSLICSGFMVFNDTQDCNTMINELGENETEDDQILVNNIVMSKYKSSCALLPIPQFPNGHMYYSRGIKNEAFIVHNNHMVGIEEKIRRFKDENLWYI
jgi:hypothetical protein